MATESKGSTSDSRHSCALHKAYANRGAYPSFEELFNPEVPETVFRYYRTERAPVMVVKRNWCFVAEIVEVIRYLRPCYTFQTRFGEKGLLAFYLDHGRNSIPGFAADKLTEGSTIFILFPERQTFVDGQVGIRQEKLETCFAIDVPFSKLKKQVNKLLFNADALHENKPRKCLRCGAKEGEPAAKNVEETAAAAATATSPTKVKLSLCGKCHMAAYCSRECQVAAWPTHKLICTHCDKLLRLACIGRHQVDAQRPFFDMNSLPPWAPLPK